MGQYEGIATAEVFINSPVTDVWKALTDPDLVKQYMYGAEIASDWQKGGSITYQGEWQGKPYADKGIILAIESNKLLKLTHYSPLSGLPDVPENYHTVTYLLKENDNGTTLRLTQENNKSQGEVDESEKTWSMMLGNLKKIVEEKGSSTS